MDAPELYIKHRKLKLHFFYVVLIMGLFLVGVITNDWTKVDGFIDYLNVAAGVTSIALGVLAIIYSFVSTGSFSQSLGAIEGSASRVAKIADELGSVLKSGQSLQTRAERRTDELHKLVEQLRSGLDALAKNTMEIASSVAELPEKVSSLQKAATREAPEAESLPSPTQWDSAALDSYLKKSSLLGIIAINAVVTATTASKFVDLEKLFGVNNEYVWGFLIASSAAGVIRIEYKEGRRGIRTVRLKNLSTELKSAIAGEWERRETSGKEIHRKVMARYNVEGALVDNED